MFRPKCLVDEIQIALTNRGHLIPCCWCDEEWSLKTPEFQENYLEVYVKEDIYKIIKKAQKKLLKVTINYTGPVEAPIKKDQILAKLKIVYDAFTNSNK